MLNYYNHITINHVETGMLFLYYWQKPKKLKTVIGETVNSIIDGQSNTKEKFVDDGAVMTKGQAILRLSNTDLELSLVQQETQVFNLLTQMQISRNAAQQNTVSKLNQLTDADNLLKEAERIYNLNKTLYAQK